MRAGAAALRLRALLLSSVLALVWPTAPHVASAASGVLRTLPHTKLARRHHRQEQSVRGEVRYADSERTYTARVNASDPLLSWTQLQNPGQEHVAEEQSSLQRPCMDGMVLLAGGSHEAEFGAEGPNVVQLYVSQCFSGEPECGGDESNCRMRTLNKALVDTLAPDPGRDRDVLSRPFRYCNGTCFSACATVHNGFELANDTTFGQVDISTTLHECGPNEGWPCFMGSTDHANNPLIGMRVRSAAQVTCSQPTPGKAGTSSVVTEVYDGVETQIDREEEEVPALDCSANNVPELVLGDKRYEFDNLDFRSVFWPVPVLGGAQSTQGEMGSHSAD